MADGAAGAAVPAPVKTFLLLNLFGFPLAGYFVALLSRLLSAIAAPVWLLILPGSGVGVVLVGANFWLCWRAWKAGGLSGTVAAMILWATLCVATLIFLGTYSPLNLALAFAMV